MEKKYVDKVKRFLTKYGYNVIKQSPNFYGTNSGEPDIIAYKGDKIKIAIEIKDFLRPSKLKLQQVYYLNKYKLQGCLVYVLDSESEFEIFKSQILKLEEFFFKNK